MEIQRNFQKEFPLGTPEENPEKHKTYHLKDEMLLRDGYKKFLKTEDCTYKNCRFSRVCNHIHCMHENCHYVLHSSGQLLSHKRKHERMDTEVDYRKLQMARNLLSKFGMGRDGDGSSGGKEDDEVPTSPNAGENVAPRNPVVELLAIMSELTFRTLPLQIMLHMRMQMLQNMGYDQVFAPDNVESLKNLAESGLNEEYLKQLYKFNENICQLNERAMLDVNPALSELAKSQGSPTPRSYTNVGEHYTQFKRKLDVDPIAGPSTQAQDPTFFNPALNKSKLLSNPSVDYRLLKKDDSGLGEAPADTNIVDRQKPLLESANFLQFSSSKTLFNRKRGRPRKNHVMEVYNNAQDSPQAIFTSFKLEKNDSKAPNQDCHRDNTAESDLKHRRDLHNRSDEEDGAKRHRSLSPSKMFLPMLDVPSSSSSMPMFATPDFGGFSQILEKHMREIKAEPSATVTQQIDLSHKDKSRNHLKCVVCNNSFETFADIKEHECHQAKEAEKPLLTFPPGLTMHQPPAFRSAYPPDAETSRLIYAPTPMGLPAAPSAAKESISLVKTTGTFFPDVNANKLKYF
ncbi:hypothetical protein RP20_CCG015044 [Aedes albopictus]|nr:hypothetical protein RP20_CCG015044 [Aedes albopictus]